MEGREAAVVVGAGTARPQPTTAEAAPSSLRTARLSAKGIPHVAPSRNSPSTHSTSHRAAEGQDAGRVAMATVPHPVPHGGDGHLPDGHPQAHTSSPSTNRKPISDMSASHRGRAINGGMSAAAGAAQPNRARGPREACAPTDHPSRSHGHATAPTHSHGQTVVDGGDVNGVADRTRPTLLSVDGSRTTSGNGHAPVRRTLSPARLNVFNNTRPLTTRPPRPGEKQGREYNFVSREEFLAFVEADEMLDWAEQDGVLYGKVRHVASPEERSAAKQSLDAQLARVRSKHQSPAVASAHAAQTQPHVSVMGASSGASSYSAHHPRPGAASESTLDTASHPRHQQPPPPPPSSAPAAPLAASPGGLGGRPRRVAEPSRFVAPEGPYVEQLRQGIASRLSRRDMADLTPSPSRLAVTEVNGRSVLATLMRDQVVWYDAGRRIGLLDEHDLGGKPCCFDIGVALDPDAGGTRAGLAIVCGLENGEIVVFSSQSRMLRAYNTAGEGNQRTCKSRCLTVQWASPSTFTVAHANGVICLYDVTKVTMPQQQPQLSPDAPPEGARRPSNPVRTWTNIAAPVQVVALSPRHTHVAAADKRGQMWVCDLRSDEGLLISQHKVSCFGAILALAWSNDGDFVVAGSQDDLVTVWSLSQQASVVRGVGHTSWVASVAFDTQASRSARELRIVSTGHDGKLLLWDFEHNLDESPPKERRARVADMTPVSEHRVSGDPVTAVLCTSDALLVANTMAEVTTWARPTQHSTRLSTQV
eukprot:m.55157 g.55157  ORF g.55157 m.55157 type:complete len:759 (+) comp7583_c0_seq2:66-2342(+)